MLLGSSPSSKLPFFLDGPLCLRRGGGLRRQGGGGGGGVEDEDEELSLFVFKYALERPRAEVTEHLRLSQGRVRAAPLYFFWTTIGRCLDLRNGILYSGISIPIKSSRVQVQRCSITQLYNRFCSNPTPTP